MDNGGSGTIGRFCSVLIKVLSLFVSHMFYSTGLPVEDWAGVTAANGSYLRAQPDAAACGLSFGVDFIVTNRNARNMNRAGGAAAGWPGWRFNCV